MVRYLGNVLTHEVLWHPPPPLCLWPKTSQLLAASQCRHGQPAREQTPGPGLPMPNSNDIKSIKCMSIKNELKDGKNVRSNPEVYWSVNRASDQIVNVISGYGLLPPLCRNKTTLLSLMPRTTVLQCGLDGSIWRYRVQTRQPCEAPCHLLYVVRLIIRWV